MYIQNCRVLFALAFAVLTAPALADDCMTVKSAMSNSGHTPNRASAGSRLPCTRFT
jgi:hypothetical protein